MAAPLVALIVTRATTLAYPELLPELARRLQTQGLALRLSLLEHEGEVDQAIEDLDDAGTVGLIAAALPSDELIARYSSSAAQPLLLYNCHRPLSEAVSCNHADCGRRLATMLLEAGHRRFGIISGPADSFVSRERTAGALEALVKPRVLALEIVDGNYDYEAGVAAIDILFETMKPRPSAILAMNDAMAMGALDRARALQVRIPRDLSIVGIDGTNTARLPVYKLTTIRQPLERMAEAAAQALVQRIADPCRPPEIRLFGGELVSGETARFERPNRRTPTTSPRILT